MKVKEFFCWLLVRPFQSGVHKAFKGKTNFRLRALQELESHIGDTAVSDKQVQREFDSYCTSYKPQAHQVMTLLRQIAGSRPGLIMAMDTSEDQ